MLLVLMFAIFPADMSPKTKAARSRHRLTAGSIGRAISSGTAPVLVKDGTSKIGVIAYGSTDFALRESLDEIKKQYDLDVDYLRVRAYPFAHEVHDFVAKHERVYIVEQDRDAQLASLLKLDLPAEQTVKLRSILHYNGLPIDARSITEEFATKEGL